MKLSWESKHRTLTQAFLPRPRRSTSSPTQSPRYRQFLTRLRAARLEAALTQEEVAVRISRPQSYVSDRESGERRVDVVELERFAKLYRKPFAYFLPQT